MPKIFIKFFLPMDEAMYHQILVDYAPKSPYNSLMSTQSQLQSQTQLAPAPATRLSRADIVLRATKALPRKEDGSLPGFYRADLVPSSSQNDEAFNPRNLDAAFVPLNSQEGFPAQPDGRPFWHKLDYESQEHFAAFELYISLVAEGPRYLANLLLSPELQRIFGDSLTHEFLQELYILYYWKERARSFDLYQQAAYRHIRMRRAQSMENYHYTKSAALVERLFDQLAEAETFDSMRHDPALLLSALEKLVKIQRISAGLPAAAPIELQSSSKGSTLVPTEFEMIMRQVTQQNISPITNSEHTTVDEAGRVISSTNNLLRGALQDPDTAQKMQEVILKVSYNNGATKRPRWMDHSASDVDVNDPAISEGDEGEDDDA